MKSKLNEVFIVKEAPGSNLPNGEEGVTVKDLIEILRKMPQDALCVEEQRSECRFLKKDNIKKSDQIADADSGDMREGSFVVFGAWD